MWYEFRSHLGTSAPMSPKWAAVYRADLKARGVSGTMRRVSAPDRPVADLHAFGHHDGRRRCGGRGLLAATQEGVTCPECRARLRL